MRSIYDFSVRTIHDEPISLAHFKGQVLLVVNVASECGYTGQYSGLQALYTRYHAQGFSVLGFPCNQFGRQEPGDDKTIHQFCTERYVVSFPMFSKIEVNGPHALPLYDWLKTQKTGILGSSSIKWNFTKFLIGRDGQVLERYGPTTKPEALESAINNALGAESQCASEGTLHD